MRPVRIVYVYTWLSTVGRRIREKRHCLARRGVEDNHTVGGEHNPSFLRLPGRGYAVALSEKVHRFARRATRMASYMDFLNSAWTLYTYQSAGGL